MPRKKRIGVKQPRRIAAYRAKRYSSRQTPYGKQKIPRQAVVRGYKTMKRQWGLAAPIQSKSIIKFEWRYNDDQIEDMLVGGNLPHEVGKIASSGKDIFYYKTEVQHAINNGCIEGFKIFTNKIAEYIPQRSGALRKDVELTVKESIPRNEEASLPVTINIGAPNVKYATIVNKYTPQFIQLQHSPGIQMSGVQRKYKYNAQLGDPKAQYHFFAIISMQCRVAIKSGIKAQLTFKGIPWAIFVFYIKTTERVVNII